MTDRHDQKMSWNKQDMREFIAHVQDVAKAQIRPLSDSLQRAGVDLRTPWAVEIDRLTAERDAALAELARARDALYAVDRMLGHDDADDEIRDIISAALAAKGE